MKQMTLVDDLKAAKALIDTPEKWAKGDYEFSGCYCALGAAAKAIGFDPNDNWLNDSRARGIERALEAALPKGMAFVPDFNDSASTTHADIMALFQRAIEAAEQAEVAK
jgi:hypothetical protein